MVGNTTARQRHCTWLQLVCILRVAQRCGEEWSVLLVHAVDAILANGVVREYALHLLTTMISSHAIYTIGARYLNLAWLSKKPSTTP